MMADETPLDTYVEHFQTRVLRDAFNQATATYWESRARTFEWALGRESDYQGRSTQEQRDERDQRLTEAATECRRRRDQAGRGGWLQ